MQVTAIIEQSKFGEYSIYTLEQFEGFGLHGYGETIEEAKRDFLISIDEMRELLGDKVPQMDVTFKMANQP